MIESRGRKLVNAVNSGMGPGFDGSKAPQTDAKLTVRDAGEGGATSRQQGLRGAVCDEAKSGRVGGRVCIIGGTRRPGRRGAKTGQCASRIQVRD